MKKIKLCGNKKTRLISFKNKFSELSVGEFAGFIVREEKIGDLEDKLEKLEAEFDELKAQDGEELTSVIIVADAEIVGVQHKIRGLQVELLAILSGNFQKTVNFIINHIHPVLVKQALSALHKTMGSFEDWVKGVKLVSGFRFTDYKRDSYFHLTKVKDFEVFNTDRTTVLRDSAASAAAAKIDELQEGLAANRWSNLPRFLAYVCRPAREKEEIAVGYKNIKSAFLGSKEVDSMSVDDRLTAYNNLLAETADLRTPIFERLPLATAIGAYKQYFFLSPP